MDSSDAVAVARRPPPSTLLQHEPPEKRQKIEDEIDNNRDEIVDDEDEIDNNRDEIVDDEDGEDEIDNNRDEIIADEDGDWEEEIYSPIPIDPQLLKKYVEQVNESEGFDLDYFYGMETVGCITPQLDLDDDYEYYSQFAQRALNLFNQKKRKAGKLELVKLLKINEQCVSRTTMFLTLVAKDTYTGMEKTYQAKFLRTMNELEIFKDKDTQEDLMGEEE